MFRATMAALLLAGSANAADWPQFLGPTRDGVSPETVAPWTAPPKVLWRKPLGEAHSSPVVADGVVYAFYKPKGKDADALTAFHAWTGEELWTKSYEREAFTPPFGAGPRGTPCVEGGHVYTLGSTGILACWDAKVGDTVWKVDTLKDLAAKNLFFGVSTSPIVVGGTVVVMVGGTAAGIVGFEKLTGKVKWKATSDPASYAGPALIPGKPATLVFLTGSHLRAMTEAGELLWSFPFKDKLNESSTTPVAFKDTVVASSVTAGSVAVRPDGAGPVEGFWKNPKLTCYFSTPVAVGSDLYMINGAASLLNASITLRCVDGATGKVRWEKPKIGKYHAALTRLADDKLLMLDDAGRLTLIQPDPTGYKQLAQSKVCGETWAHPALAGGVLYVRDNDELIALKLAK
jgi:outer membrane protein assembly factor BamB